MKILSFIFVIKINYKDQSKYIKNTIILYHFIIRDNFFIMHLRKICLLYKFCMYTYQKLLLLNTFYFYKEVNPDTIYIYVYIYIKNINL